MILKNDERDKSADEDHSGLSFGEADDHEGTGNPIFLERAENSSSNGECDDNDNFLGKFGLHLFTGLRWLKLVFFLFPDV